LVRVWLKFKTGVIKPPLILPLRSRSDCKSKLKRTENRVFLRVKEDGGINIESFLVRGQFPFDIKHRLTFF